MSHLLHRINHARAHYPREIWILFWGTLISMTGQSFVWPFLTIYIREQLDVPLSQIGLLLSIQSVAAMSATALLGSLMDRWGRKWAMIIGPLLTSLMLVLMTGADSLSSWGILLAFYAVAGAGFRLGAMAMLADLIPPAERAGGYALIRMASNVGIAIGPAVGGFMVATSYQLSFFIAAGVQFMITFFVLFFLSETLPRRKKLRNRQKRAGELEPAPAEEPETFGYAGLLRDRPFLSVFGAYLLINIASALVFVLLAVYIKEQFGIPEDRFGFILGTNAAMVVLLQYGMTRITKRFRPLPVMAVGAAFYAAGLLAFGLAAEFWGFWLGIVILTTGELIIEPTSAALIANLAPPRMRARYMGLYALSYRVGAGIGPVLGGLLSDNLAPVAIWYGGSFLCMLAMVSYLVLARGRMFRQEAAALLAVGD